MRQGLLKTRTGILGPIHVTTLSAETVSSLVFFPETGSTVQGSTVQDSTADTAVWNPVTTVQFLLSKFTSFVGSERRAVFQSGYMYCAVVMYNRVAVWL